MEGLTQALMIIGLFLLRLGVPLAITVVVAYFFHRLDARWQRESDVQSVAAAGQPAAAAQKPCWEERGCPESKRENCPAHKYTDLPCWLARLKVEGQLPAACVNCSRFAPVPVSA